MALLRDKHGQLVKSGGENVVVETAGEMRERTARQAKLVTQRGVREDNLALRAKRSPLQQLRILDMRLGTGVGANRERKRLLAAIEKVRVG